MTTDTRSFLEKYFKHLVLSLGFLFVIYFVIIFLTPFAHDIGNCRTKKNITAQQWNGTVYKKELLEYNHNTEGLFITNYNSCLPLIGENDRLYNIVNLGDSVVKDVGSLKVTVYKKDSIINYDYFINCNE